MLQRNTWFKQPIEKLATFRSVGVKAFEPPYATNRFAQIDFITAQQGLKHRVEDVTTTDEVAVETDHKLLRSQINYNLGKKRLDNSIDPKSSTNQQKKKKGDIANPLKMKATRRIGRQKLTQYKDSQKSS